MKRTDPVRRLTIGILALAVWGIIPNVPGGVTALGQTSAPQNQELVKVVETRRAYRLPDRVKAQPPAALATAEKVRRVKAIMASLRDQDVRNRGLGLGQRFPLGLASQATMKFPKLQAENRMSPKHPYLGTTASLTFAQPSYVSGYADNSYFPAAVASDGVHLTIYLDVIGGKTYLLDYAIGKNPPPLRVVIVDEMGEGTELQIAVVNGHLLLPFQATGSGNYVIFVDPRTAPFEFYSVEINTVE